jgi:RimJ/RimL family protein N-acetyltransferase
MPTGYLLAAEYNRITMSRVPIAVITHPARLLQGGFTYKDALKLEWRKREAMASIPKLRGYPKDFTLNDGVEVELRPLESRDHMALLNLFQQIPEEDLYYLKDTVTDSEVIRDWTLNINLERVISIVALVEDTIIADATLHRSRVFARKHTGEVRIVVDPEYRGKGVGRRLIRELLDIAAELDLYRVYIELVPEREDAAIGVMENLGFKKVATLPGRIRDYYGSYKEVVVLEIPLSDRSTWWKE